MAQRKVTYKEGDWIAVPLRDGGYAIGKIARVGKYRALFGYFFGPRFDRLPTADDVKNIKITDYVLAARYGDMGLRDDGWTVIDRPEHWNRDEWPMLEFISIEPLMGKATCVRYDEEGLERVISVTPCSPDLANVLPKDSMYGHGAIEIALRKLLSQAN